MTLNDMITTARYFLDDDSSSRIENDDELIFYINMAYEYYYNDLINRDYPRFRKSVILDVVDGFAELPDDFVKAHIVYKSLDSSLVPLEYYVNFELVEDTIGGDSGCYSFEGNYIKLYGQTTGQIKLIYYPVLVNLELSADEPLSGFLSSWQKLIPLQAAIMVKGGREEEDTVDITKIIQKLEIPYNDYLTKLTNSRCYVQSFIP